jgi:NAD(P)-dependent dehydrogenase (short-subunit alcohol dehydrogenase family)
MAKVLGAKSTAQGVTEGLDLSGKSYLITGCNAGLGQESLRVLCLRGAKVVGLARSMAKAQAACAPHGPGAIPRACDLGDPASVRACVEGLKAEGWRFDAILANAGIMALPERTLLHGVEAQFYTNHVGHFQLVTGLLEQLAEGGRVVVTSSRAHLRAPQGGIDFDNLDGAKGYAPWTAYGQSKFANLLFAKALAKRLRGTGKSAYALHPGVIRTELMRHMGLGAQVAMWLARPWLKSIPQGAATQVLLATASELAAPSGAYYADCLPTRPRPDAEDAALADRLWAETVALLKRVEGASTP